MTKNDAMEMRALSTSEMDAVGGGQFIGQFAPAGWSPLGMFIRQFGVVLGVAFWAQSRNYYPPLH
ncbi:MAG: hypothetical protein AB7F78_06520 [Hyphomicrobiaceae bacterium]